MVWFLLRPEAKQERTLTIGLLVLDFLDVIRVLHLEVHGDGSRLDSDTTLLFILTGVHETGLTSTTGRDNTGLGHKRIGKSRLAVIDVSNDGHVTNVRNLVLLAITKNMFSNLVVVLAFVVLTIRPRISSTVKFTNRQMSEVASVYHCHGNAKTVA